MLGRRVPVANLLLDRIEKIDKNKIKTIDVLYTGVSANQINQNYELDLTMFLFVFFSTNELRQLIYKNKQRKKKRKINSINYLYRIIIATGMQQRVCQPQEQTAI